MSKNKRMTKNCSVQNGDSNIDNVEQAKKTVTVNVGNNSPQHSYDSRVSGHSTPIHRRDCAFDNDDSPERDYRCSPIWLPCTQDGGNEIGWDWQTSNSKSSNDKARPPNNSVETPKRTKQLQKKRNSNSPLLQKPLKRKQVKMENIENIGKLTAELKALSERMRIMQQGCKNQEEDKEETQCEFESKLLIELDNNSNEDIMVDGAPSIEELKAEPVPIKEGNKKDSNYDDLFDDSIDDSMAKCSQEIEEKLNLCKGQGINTLELSMVNKEKESLCTSDKEFPCLAVSNTSSETSRIRNNSKNSSNSTSSNLKTYSNNSSKTNSMSNSKHFNNYIINASDGKQKLQNKTMSEFPDDSFDDCLATCIEDDKLLSKLSEYDFSPPNSGHNTSYSRRMAKPVASNNNNTSSNKKASNNLTSRISPNDKYNKYQNSKLITDELVDEIDIFNDKETIKRSFPSKNALENRKFFKTKSLSDQSFYQIKNASIISNSIKTTNSIVSSEKRSQTNSVNPSVSTTFPIARGQNPYKGNNFVSNNGMENAHAFNRLEEKEAAGNCIIKYKSTSNLFSTKEVKESQPMQCTPEEIERKRLEAKMKLEAKRKLQQTSNRIGSTPLEVPVKKSVKR